MSVVHRHQLVFLREAGWQRLIAEAAGDAERQAVLRRWAGAGWPLVVSRQPCAQPAANDPGQLHLGLTTPPGAGPRRWPVVAAWSELLFFAEFPRADQVLPLLSASQRPAWRQLLDGLAGLDVPARVYGSHGWELLTGQPHRRPGSDLDLYLPVQHVAQADALVALLQRADAGLPRLDGELIWPDGAAVAWREWQAWREGQVRDLLVKRLHSVELLREWPGVEALPLPAERVRA